MEYISKTVAAYGQFVGPCYNQGFEAYLFSIQQNYSCNKELILKEKKTMRKI